MYPSGGGDGGGWLSRGSWGCVMGGLVLQGEQWWELGGERAFTFEPGLNDSLTHHCL